MAMSRVAESAVRKLDGGAALRPSAESDAGRTTVEFAASRRVPRFGVEAGLQ